MSDPSTQPGPGERARMLRRLLDEHAAALELFARQYCHTPEDIVQEAMIRFAAQSRPPESGQACRGIRGEILSEAQSAEP